MSVTHTSWNLPIDKTLFTNTFRAESDWYNRKVGIVSTILFGGFAVAYIWALVWSAKTGVSLDVSGDPYLYAIVIVGMAVFAVFVTVRPGDATAFRNHVAIRHLTEHYVGRSFTVKTEEAGLRCRIGTDRLSVPYAAITKAVTVDGMTWFTTAAARESSVIYNIMGINWALRETGSLSIPVPNETLTQYPSLVADVLAAGKDQRAGLKRGNSTAMGCCPNSSARSRKHDGGDARTPRPNGHLRGTDLQGDGAHHRREGP